MMRPVATAKSCKARPIVQQLRIKRRTARISANGPRKSTLGDVDLAIDFFVGLAGTQPMIRIDEDSYTVEGLIADLQDRSKTIILLRSCPHPATGRQPFIHAFQLGTIARKMLVMLPFKAHRSARPASLSGEVECIGSDMAVGGIPDT